MRDASRAVGSGFIAELVGSLCCVTPLVLVLLGLSGVAGAMGLAAFLQQNFRWTLFIPLGIIFLTGSLYYSIKRKVGVCNVQTIKRYKAFVIGTIVFAIIVWAPLIYVIEPAIFEFLS